VPGSDFIVKTGDQAMFSPAFGVATVVVVPGSITGSGTGRVDGSIFCVEGDEASVVVPGVAYMTASFPIPGSGTLTIDTLGSDQSGQKTNSSQKAVIIKGSTFTAKFTVVLPASVVVAGAPSFDSVTSYTGSGQFVTTNVRSKGT
jgi:hypothetical protein